MTTGSCLCGAICFRIEGDLNEIQICHCTQCQRAQGGPFASNIPVDSNKFFITSGEEKLKAFESPTRKGKSRLFCSECGSPMFSRLESDPEFVRVRAGTIDKPVQVKIKHHQFAAFKATWFELSDDHPQYDDFPPK